MKRARLLPRSFRLIQEFAMFDHLALSILVAASLLGAGGCGQSGESNLSGAVTYNGEPVAKGFITFTPTASGTSVGVEVVDGKYTTEKARPGQFIAVVQGDRDTVAPMTREQAEQQAKAAQGKPQSPNYIP